MARRSIEYNARCFEISYEKSALDSVVFGSDVQTNARLIENPPLVFLHGWGSNKELMKIAFGKYFKDYKHIYIDMPGFGDSPNEYALHTEDYARIIEKFLQEVSGVGASECILVGHSFGGKVAVLLQPKELILLSSAGIKIPKSFNISCKIMLAKILGKLGLCALGRIFRSNDVKQMNEGMYQTFKNVVNEDFTAHFAAYRGKVSIFWGKDDTATPLICADRIASLTQDNRLFIMDGDHYFFLKQGEEIERLYKQDS